MSAKLAPRKAGQRRRKKEAGRGWSYGRAGAVSEEEKGRVLSESLNATLLSERPSGLTSDIQSVAFL